jgi:hypothetical protein
VKRSVKSISRRRDAAESEGWYGQLDVSVVTILIPSAFGALFVSRTPLIYKAISACEGWFGDGLSSSARASKGDGLQREYRRMLELLPSSRPHPSTSLKRADPVRAAHRSTASIAPWSPSTSCSCSLDHAAALSLEHHLGGHYATLSLFAYRSLFALRRVAPTRRSHRSPRAAGSLPCRRREWCCCFDGRRGSLLRTCHR